MATRTSAPRSVLGLRSSRIISRVEAKSRQCGAGGEELERQAADDEDLIAACSQSLPGGVMMTGLSSSSSDGCLSSAFGAVTPVSR